MFHLAVARVALAPLAVAHEAVAHVAMVYHSQVLSGDGGPCPSFPRATSEGFSLSASSAVAETFAPVHPVRIRCIDFN